MDHENVESPDPEIARLRRELRALRERVEQLAGRIGLDAPHSAAGAVPPDVATGAAQAARTAAARAAETERLKAELRDTDRLAAMRFEAAIRLPNGGSQSWSQTGNLTRRSSDAFVRRVAQVLAALGSEPRVKLLLLLWDGEKGAQELAEGTGLGTGSLYHHMRELLALQWIESPQRNRYVLTGTGRQILVMAWALGQTVRV